MGGLRAPGQDGFQGIFYHEFWDIIVGDVIGMVEDFVGERQNPRKLNSTHIVLIPKTANPTSWLPAVISPAYNAFVEGRQIQDNILVAYEAFNFLKLRKVKTKFELAMKINVKKAYDKIEWDFLETLMVRMGFNRGKYELAGILGMPQVMDLGNYLGLPMMWGRSKMEALTFVKDRVMAKIQGWKHGFLSQAGREMLIKAVMQAIPAYPMNIFCFLDNICNDIDVVVANFW
ncbi:uncharacterized protein [Malus domestica]|uniref:uncharacterized protein n=1 Tax=Malus domestica TaxID=3750 RepID=UPI0039747B6B